MEHTEQYHEDMDRNYPLRRVTDKAVAAVSAPTDERAALPLEQKDDLNWLLSNMDAKVWADEFCKLNPAADNGLMTTWFACAIMTGFDEATRRAARAAAPVSGPTYEELAADLKTARATIRVMDKNKAEYLARNAELESAAPVSGQGDARFSQVWNDALNEAALICDGVNNHDNPMTVSECADAIRAMRTAP